MAHRENVAVADADFCRHAEQIIRIGHSCPVGSHIEDGDFITCGEGRGQIVGALPRICRFTNRPCNAVRKLGGVQSKRNNVMHSVVEGGAHQRVHARIENGERRQIWFGCCLHARDRRYDDAAMGDKPPSGLDGQVEIGGVFAESFHQRGDIRLRVGLWGMVVLHA